MLLKIKVLFSLDINEFDINNMVKIDNNYLIVGMGNEVFKSSKTQFLTKAVTI